MKSLTRTIINLVLVLLLVQGLIFLPSTVGAEETSTNEESTEDFVDVEESEEEPTPADTSPETAPELAEEEPALTTEPAEDKDEETEITSVKLDGEFIAVEGSAIKMIESEYAQVDIAVVSEAGTVAEAANLNTLLMEKVMAKLLELGVSEEDLQTRSLNVNSQMDYNATPPYVYGYEVENRLIVKVRNIDDLGLVIAGALDAGANRVDSVAYLVDDTSTAYLEALASAVREAKIKAEILAESLGLSIAPAPVSVEEYKLPDYYYYNTYNYDAKMEAAEDSSPIPMQAQQTKVDARVKAVYRIIPASGLADFETKIVVSGSAVQAVEPEYAELLFAVETQDASAIFASRENTAKMEAIFELIQSLGIDQKDYETTSFQVHPLYDYSYDKARTYGYLVSNELKIKIRDLEGLGEFITQILNTGANRLYYIEYGIESRSSYYKEGLKQATTQARDKAQTIAEASGLAFDAKVSFIAENSLDSFNTYTGNYGYDEAMMEGMGAAGGMPIASADVIVGADVQIEYIINK